MSTRAQLIADMNAKIISGGRSTSAANLRSFETDMINSSVNKTDDANVANGYLAIDNTGIVDITFIKKATPTGQFLKDNGTWATVLTGASTLNQVLTAGNTSSGKNSIWSNGDFIYLGSASNGKLYWDNAGGATNLFDSGTGDGLSIKQSSGGVSLKSNVGNVTLGTTSHILSIDEASGFDLEVNGGNAQIAISAFTNQIYVTTTGTIDLDAPSVVIAQQTASRSTYINASNQLVSSTIQADGNNLFFVSNYGIDSVATSPPSSVLNIGATNANTINYGNSTTVHNFLGTAIYELQVNSYVTDKLMTLNYGGAVSSGIGVGFEIEENSVITGYLKTNAARSGYSFKAPANTTYTDLIFTATTARAMTFPDRDLTIDNITTATTSNGTGFVKANGSVISFDNSTYLTTSSASNGLTITSGTIKLGGALTAATNITGAFTLSLGTTGSRLSNLVSYATTSITLFAGSSGSPTAYSSLFAYGSASNYTAGFQSTDATDIVEVVSTPTTYQILLTATNPIIDINNAGATVANNGTNNVFVVNDAAAKGIIYASDYSANFTPESLVTKRWVGATYQPLDSDLTTIAGLTATTDNFIVSVSSAWASRTPTQVKTTLSLNNVENTALSTWAGTTNITTLGTVATGTWNASLIIGTYGGTGVNNGTKTFTYLKNISFTAADDTGVYTLPTGTKTLVATDVSTLSSLASIGTITTGVWNGTLIGATYGGTGVANNASSTWTISGNFATTVTVSATTAITLPTSGTLYGTKAGSITSAQMLASMSNPTGTGLSVFATSPTFTTQITTPLIYGGTAVGSTLTLSGTSGNGTSTVAAIAFNVGNAGATNAMNIYNSGLILVNGVTAPGGSLSTMRITKGTGFIDFGERTSGFSAIWFDTATPSSTNWALGTTASGASAINGTASIRFVINNSINATLSSLVATWGGGQASYNFSFTSTAGTKLGITTSEKIGFWNTAPVVQPASTGTTTSGFTANTSANAVCAESTFTGNTGSTAYTISDIVKNLKTCGLLAS